MTTARVVVGASHAGAELAARLRQLAPHVPVVMIGDEEILPYQRPPLSKGWLGDPAAQADALLIRNAAAYASAGIEVRSGVRVAAIERDARRLGLDDGDTLDYVQLALATGARPRRLATPDVDRAEQAPNFHYLRALADAARLRPRLTPGARIVVIGGGYIGLELASLAIKRGLQPVVLEAQPRVLARRMNRRPSGFTLLTVVRAARQNEMN
ncbi:MAG: FAD-dependent oxidoreductase [Proteobacteria bacterium]|nr:FAD-dependent oxidoreductase [Pseudomonadota bacterium]